MYTKPMCVRGYLKVPVLGSVPCACDPASLPCGSWNVTPAAIMSTGKEKKREKTNTEPQQHRSTRPQQSNSHQQATHEKRARQQRLPTFVPRLLCSVLGSAPLFCMLHGHGVGALSNECQTLPEPRHPRGTQAMKPRFLAQKLG